MIGKENTTPARVSTDVLRKHFAASYNLKEEQIDLMLASSAKSLNKSLTALYEALDKRANLEELAKLGHNIKGVLLNMGEAEWAAIARKIEVSAAAGRSIDYRSMVEQIHQGVEDVL